MALGALVVYVWHHSGYWYYTIRQVAPENSWPVALDVCVYMCVCVCVSSLPTILPILLQLSYLDHALDELPLGHAHALPLRAVGVVYGAGGAPRQLGREVLPELGGGGLGVRAWPETEIAEEVLVVHDIVVVVRLEVLGENGDRVRWVERGGMCVGRG